MHKWTRKMDIAVTFKEDYHEEGKRYTFQDVQRTKWWATCPKTLASLSWQIQKTTWRAIVYIIRSHQRCWHGWVDNLRDKVTDHQPTDVGMVELTNSKDNMMDHHTFVPKTWPFVFFVPMVIYPMGNSGRFPQGKPAATESRYPTLINHKVHAGSFCVFIIHRTLTWTTGSSTCIRDYSYACVYTRPCLSSKNEKWCLIYGSSRNKIKRNKSYHQYGRGVNGKHAVHTEPNGGALKSGQEHVHLQWKVYSGVKTGDRYTSNRKLLVYQQQYRCVRTIASMSMCMCACKCVHFVLFTYLAFVKFYVCILMYCVALAYKCLITIWNREA